MLIFVIIITVNNNLKFSFIFFQAYFLHCLNCDLGVRWFHFCFMVFPQLLQLSLFFSAAKLVLINLGYFRREGGHRVL